MSENIKYFRLILHVFCLLSVWSVGEYKVFSSSTACTFVFCPRVSNFGLLSENIQCFRLVLHVFLSSVRALVTLVVCRRVYSVFVQYCVYFCRLSAC